MLYVNGIYIFFFFVNRFDYAFQMENNLFNFFLLFYYIFLLFLKVFIKNVFLHFIFYVGL